MRLSDLAARLRGVQWSGDSKFVACCPAHDDDDPSFSASVGDDGRILIHCFAGDEPEDCVAALGLSMADLMPPKLSLAHSNGRIAPHVKLWRAASGSDGTLAETYLRARGITISLPASLRYLPDALYQDGEDRQKLPAMIASIQIEQTLIGVHRTYLAPDGSSKAEVSKAKKMLGAAKGGAVRLGPTTDRIGIAEGIETALSAMQADGLTVWAALSEDGLKSVVIPPNVKEVIIYPDNDPPNPKTGLEPGPTAARALAQRLLLNQIRVGIKWPPTKEKDFNDILRESGEQAIREIPIQWEDASKANDLPTIDAENGNLWSVLNAVTDAVQRWNSPPKLFVHETTGKLVKLVWRAPKEKSENTAHLVMDEVTTEGYRNILAAAARWMKFRKRGADEVFPPKEVVTAAYDHAREGRFLPPLRAVVYSPTFAPSGRLLKPGYDAETHLWYAEQEDDPEGDDIDADPNAVEGAIALLNDALCDFLFESEGDKAHAVSLFFLPFVREMIDGPIPLYNIEAPIAGTGKGLLTRVLLRPSNSFRMVPETTREDEQEKQITAVCVNAWPAAVIDNVSNVVKSPLLASIVTSKEPELRVMGSYKMVRVMRVPIFVITANNPSFSEENARRVARVRIVSPIEQPSEREGFKHPQLETWMEESRADLCRAAVTMVRAWLVAGRPRSVGRPWGSFESWADIMGGLTHFLGFEGFGTARIEKDAIDSSESRWRELIDRWAEKYATEPMPAAQIADVATGIDGFFTEREKGSKGRVIGNGLRARKDRIFGKWKLTLGKKTHGIFHWKLIKMGE